MPAVVSSVEWSSARGISDAEGWRRWPFSSKKDRNPSRSSGVVRIERILRARPSAPGRPRGLFDPQLEPEPLERAADQARDVHLRDPDPRGDLRLGQPLVEPQEDDPPL